MHYHWEVLVQAEDEAQAKVKAEELLDELKDKCWDWYQLGGRWDRGGDNIICATHKEFWPRVDQILETQQASLATARRVLHEQMTEQDVSAADLLAGNATVPAYSLVWHLLGRIAQVEARYYCSESHFATDGDLWGGPELPEEQRETIREFPSGYWLLTYDLHN